MPNTIIRLPDVISRTGLSKTSIYDRMKAGDFPRSIPLGAKTFSKGKVSASRAVGWIEAEVQEWVDGNIRAARGETIATAIEQADGLLSGLGAGEATNASASIPAVSELPIEPTKTRSPRREHHLKPPVEPYQHHLNELQRIRRENEMAEAE